MQILPVGKREHDRSLSRAGLQFKYPRDGPVYHIAGISPNEVRAAFILVAAVLFAVVAPGAAAWWNYFPRRVQVGALRSQR
jgi:hypothetical protein